jgi:hypothetical protein
VDDEPCTDSPYAEENALLNARRITGVVARDDVNAGVVAGAYALPYRSACRGGAFPTGA